MISDWNFWLSVITVAVALMALWQTHKQIKLSNKQQLFDRRLNAFTIADGLYELCLENKIVFVDFAHGEPNFANDLNFVWITNNTYMEQQADSIKHPLEAPYHADFLRKREELRNLAKEILFIFKGKEAKAYSDFVSAYEEVLFKMYQYEIVLNQMRKLNEDKPQTIEELQRQVPEEDMRQQLNNALAMLKQMYQRIADKNYRERLIKQVKLN